MTIDLKDLLKIDLKDEVIIFETDTVYGIGCLIDSEIGIKKIYEIKNRDIKIPLAVLCSSIEQVKKLVRNFDSGSDIAKRFWPGALTLIFDKTSAVSDSITSGFSTVGVRIPNDKIALSILEKYGPMAVTSLNISSEPAVLKFKDTLRFESSVDFLINGKDLSSMSSTVYDCVNKVILRQGDIEIG